MVRRNNKGFSYVEMIIVIAIVGILIALLSISIGTVNRNNALRASEELESLVNNARVNALTKGLNYGVLTIAKDETGVYAYSGKKQYSVDVVKSQGKRICGSKVTVSVNGSSDSLMYIEFKQSTGGLVDGMITGSYVDHVEVKTESGNTVSKFKIYSMGKVIRKD